MNSAEAPELYRLADLVIDVGAARAQRGTEFIELPALSFDTLVHLVRRAPDVVTVDELSAAVWQGIAVSDETVTQRIALLRRALGDDSRDPRYVRSVRGKGYQLVPQAVRQERRLRREQDPADASPPSSKRARVLALAAVAGTVAVLALGYLERVAGRDQRTAREATALEGTATGAAPSAAELVERGWEYLARHRDADNELAVTLFRNALEMAPDHPSALA